VGSSKSGNRTYLPGSWLSWLSGFGDVSVGYPRYSPDGKWLALAVQPVGNSFVAVMPADGGKPETIYNRPGASYSYGWSPDSDKVLFGGFHDGAWNLYWVSRTTKKVQKLSEYTLMRTYVRYPEWSPAGDQIVYEFNESKGNVFIAEVRWLLAGWDRSNENAEHQRCWKTTAPTRVSGMTGSLPQQ
jgi:WD40-like Beta Propeller Repeat